MQERDNALSLLIEKSIDLKSKVERIDEKATNQFQNKKARKTTNIGDLIQELESSIRGMMTGRGLQDCSDQNVIEVKNHLIDLYQRVAVNLLKKHHFYSEKLQSTDREWQETCDQLINEQQALKDDRDRTEAELQAKMKQMTEQLDGLKTDHYKVVKANEENTEKLKTELSNSLNAHYLKNILTSYFTTSDSAVQLSLLKVVFKVMKYSEEE